MQTTQPTVYFSHGGGPMPLYDPSSLGLKTSLENLAQSLQRPDKILIFSAHWEERKISILNNKNAKSLFFDYYGFPPQTYQLKYPAPGSDELENQVAEIFRNNSIDFKTSYDRGYDHGVFVPLLIMYPQADIPIIQISLYSNLDPLTHMKIGELLAPLRSQNVLILGSGSSYHNLQAWFSGKDISKPSSGFDKWLGDVLVSDKSPEEKKELLRNWKKAPYGIECHPREEHLVPLFVMAGAAGYARAERCYDEFLEGAKHSNFLFK